MSDFETEVRGVVNLKESRARELYLDELVDGLDVEQLDALTRVMLEPDLDPVVRDIATRYFCRRARQTDSWIDDFTGWLARCNVPPERALPIISDVSWALRDVGLSPFATLRLSDLIADGKETAQLHLRAVVYLQSARFDFNFQAIDRALSALSANTKAFYPAYFEAIDLFAAYGAQRLSAPERALDLASNTSDAKVLHVIAHALWFSSDPRDCQALLTVTDRLLAISDKDAVARFRQSAAYRRLGDFDAAAHTISTAIAQSDAARIETTSMLVDELQRVFIQRDSSRAMSEFVASESRSLVAKMEEAESRVRDEMARELERGRDANSEAQFKMVEILGLFTALIAIGATVVAGSGAANLEWWQRLAVIAGGVVGTLLFFVALRMIVRPPRR